MHLNLAHLANVSLMHILRFYAPGIPIHSFLKWYPKMYINNVGGKIANSLLKTIFIKKLIYIKLT